MQVLLNFLINNPVFDLLIFFWVLFGIGFSTNTMGKIGFHWRKEGIISTVIYILLVTILWPFFVAVGIVEQWDE